MDVSRRDFLRFSVGAAGGTALAGLVGSGVNLGPVVAQAQELRIKNAKVTPSVCPYCSVGCGTLIYTVNDQIVNIEGDPAESSQRGHPLPEGRSDLPAPRQSQSPNPGSPSRRRRRRLGGLGPRAGDEPRRRAGEEDARRDLHREAAQRQSRQYDAGHFFPRRRHARSRIQPRASKAHARTGDSRHREPSTDMTQL